MTTEVVGAPVKRVEDARFTTGKGRYLDDIKLPSMAHVAVLRSPYAHANIKRIDTAAAKAMPGVIAVIVGADIPYNPLPMAWPAGGVSGIQNNISTPRALAMADTASTTLRSASEVGVERPAEFVGVRSSGRSVPVARQPTARERTPRDHAYPLCVAQRQHLALLLAVEQIDVILHRGEPRPAVRLGDVEHGRELPGKH